MKNKHPHHRLGIAVLSAFIIVPVTTQVLIGSVTETQEQSVLRERALQDVALTSRSTYRRNRRAFKEAINNCEMQRTKTGKDITCPDINDPESFSRFLFDTYRTDAESIDGISAYDWHLGNREAHRESYQKAVSYCEDEHDRVGSEVLCPSLSDESALEAFLLGYHFRALFEDDIEAASDSAHVSHEAASEDVNAQYEVSDQSSFRRNRRAFKKATEECKARLQRGEKIDCPDFNDPQSFLEYLRAERKVAKTPVDTSGTSHSIRGILNSRAYFEMHNRKQPATLKDRLEELRKARAGEGQKREDTKPLSIEGYQD